MEKAFAVNKLLLGCSREPLCFPVPLPRLSPLNRDRDKKQMDRHASPPPFHAKKPQKESASAAQCAKRPQKARLLPFCGPIACFHHRCTFIPGRRKVE
jgi:hypothetical protein